MTFSFMLQKNNSYLLTKLLQDPYMGRTKQRTLLSLVEGTEQSVEQLALHRSCHCRLNKQLTLVKSNEPDRERGMEAEKLPSSREFTAFPTYESPQRARTAQLTDYPMAVLHGNTTVCRWANTKTAVLTLFWIIPEHQPYQESVRTLLQCC